MPASVVSRITRRGQCPAKAGKQHRDLGTAVVVDILCGEHVRSGSEVDHAHRARIVDMGHQRSVRAQPENVDRVVSSRAKGGEAGRDVRRIGR